MELIALFFRLHLIVKEAHVCKDVWARKFVVIAFITVKPEKHLKTWKHP